MSKAKRNSLLLLALTFVLVALLAMSLQQLKLSPGQPFALPDQSGAQGVSSVSESNLLSWLFRGAMALVVILMPVYIVYSLLTKQGRRRLVANVIMLGLFLLIADQLQKQALERETEAQEIALADPNIGPGEAGPPISVFDETPPAWLTVAVILGAAAAVIALAALALWFYRERRKPKVDVQLEALAEAAQQTIQTIHEGGDFKASVIACYREMSRVVQEQRGIARDIAMTPREFEDVLIRRGLPDEATRTLTRLFESVRYGSAANGTRETEQAVACLTEIALACKHIGGAYARH